MDHRNQSATTPKRRRITAGVTLEEVAEAAGVSRSTAARSLGAYGAVDPTLRQRVLDVATRLGYRSNALARSVSSGRSHTIGVVVSDIENPHFARAVRGISDVASKRGFDVILTNTDEKMDSERAAVQVMLDKRVDGLVVAPASGMTADHLQEVLDMPRPLVLLDRAMPHLQCDWVGADDYSSTRTVVQMLATNGYRRLELIAATSRSAADIESGSYRPISPIAERIRALREGCQELGLEYRLHTGAMSRERTRAAVRTVLSELDGPCALLGSYSEISLVIYRELRDRHLLMPDQVALVSLDDAEWMTLSSPTVSAVGRPSYQMGLQAAQILIDRIDGQTFLPIRRALDNVVSSRESDGALHSRLAQHSSFRES